MTNNCVGIGCNNLVKKKVNKYCSRECYSNSCKGKPTWNKGLILGPNPEHSERMKGRTPWNKDTKGIVKVNSGSIKKGERRSIKTEFKKGQKHTLEWKKMMSARFSGENGNSWKGGITPKNQRIRASIEFRLWREAVFARDNWTCQKYGVRGGKLHAHHIQNFAQYPELRFAIDNGITLSDKAHREFHKKYGIKNNTPEQVEEFIKN